MRYFPVFLDLRDRLCVIVGGGAVASRKAELLAKAGARILVVAPALAPTVAAEVAAGRYRHRAARFAPEHLDGATLVVAATGDRSVDAQVARHARLRGLPVNVVDDPEHCSFIVPAVIDRSPVVVAVSTGGASPSLARWVRGRIEAALPARLGRLAELLGRHRRRARALVPDPAARRRLWDDVIAGPAAARALDGDVAGAEAALEQALAAPGALDAGEVVLVGAGPGDPELLTLAAVRALEGADVVIYDRLVGPEILERARRDAERIFVGKERGAHAMAQEEINTLLVAEARRGRRVVRLKGGDPLVFGRGGEEIRALADAGIRWRVVPGISAALGAAAASGIPLTDREAALACTLITGQTRAGAPEPDWRAYAGPGQTLVVYMGLAALPRIAAGLIGHGRAPGTPACVIENATLASERRVHGSLGDIAERVRAAGLEGPALIVIGEVVALAPGRIAAAAAPLARAG